MALLSLLGKALGVVADTLGGSKSAKAVKIVQDAIAGNPELKQSLAELEAKERSEIREMFKAEMQSEDPFVRRVRPGILWVVAGIVAINFGLLPIINAFITGFGGMPIVLDYPDLPEPVYWMMSTMYLGYAGARSFDKMKKK